MFFQVELWEATLRWSLVHTDARTTGSATEPPDLCTVPTKRSDVGAVRICLLPVEAILEKFKF